MESEKRLVKDREFVQRLLQTGLASAAILMLIGVVVKGLSGDLSAPEVRLFEIFESGLSTGDRIMGLGILLLSATPVFRVFALLVLWLRERDWRFATVAAVVLATLVLAIALGGG